MGTVYQKKIKPNEEEKSLEHCHFGIEWIHRNKVGESQFEWNWCSSQGDQKEAMPDSGPELSPAERHRARAGYGHENDTAGP